MITFIPELIIKIQLGGLKKFRGVKTMKPAYLMEDGEIHPIGIAVAVIALMLLGSMIYVIVDMGTTNNNTRPLSASLQSVSIDNYTVKLKLALKEPSRFIDPFNLVFIVHHETLRFGIVYALKTPTTWLCWSNVSTAVTQYGWIYIVNITNPDGDRVNGTSAIETNSTVTIQEVQYSGIAGNAISVASWYYLNVALTYSGYYGGTGIVLS